MSEYPKDFTVYNSKNHEPVACLRRHGAHSTTFLGGSEEVLLHLRAKRPVTYDALVDVLKEEGLELRPGLPTWFKQDDEFGQRILPKFFTPDTGGWITEYELDEGRD